MASSPNEKDPRNERKHGINDRDNLGVFAIAENNLVQQEGNKRTDPNEEIVDPKK
jgi:hypothetical protein